MNERKREEKRREKGDSFSPSWMGSGVTQLLTRSLGDTWPVLRVTFTIMVRKRKEKKQMGGGADTFLPEWALMENFCLFLPVFPAGLLATMTFHWLAYWRHKARGYLKESRVDITVSRERERARRCIFTCLTSRARVQEWQAGQLICDGEWSTMRAGEEGRGERGEERSKCI